MDIDEEFAALDLAPAQQTLAWEARAKITWGEPGDQVQSWLIAQGLAPITAQQVIALTVHERARAIRLHGVRDLVLGLLAGSGGAGLGLGALALVNRGLVAVPLRGLAVVVALAFLGFMYGAHLTWRGVARLFGGARIRGAVSDVRD